MTFHYAIIGEIFLNITIICISESKCGGYIEV